MAEWFSIEVANADGSARLWADAHGDALIQAGLGEGAEDWTWRHLSWGSVLELAFPGEVEFDRFHALAVVEAALDVVPDRVNGLVIHRGRGGSTGTRTPRRPRPAAGSGAVAVPLPADDFIWSVVSGRAMFVEPFDLDRRRRLPIHR